MLFFWGTNLLQTALIRMKCIHTASKRRANLFLLLHVRVDEKYLFLLIELTGRLLQITNSNRLDLEGY